MVTLETRIAKAILDDLERRSLCNEAVTLAGLESVIKHTMNTAGMEDMRAAKDALVKAVRCVGSRNMSAADQLAYYKQRMKRIDYVETTDGRIPIADDMVPEQAIIDRIFNTGKVRHPDYVVARDRFRDHIMASHPSGDGIIHITPGCKPVWEHRDGSKTDLPAEET